MHKSSKPGEFLLTQALRSRMSTASVTISLVLSVEVYQNPIDLQLIDLKKGKWVSS